MHIAVMGHDPVAPDPNDVAVEQLDRCLTEPAVDRQLTGRAVNNRESHCLAMALGAPSLVSLGAGHDGPLERRELIV